WIDEFKEHENYFCVIYDSQGRVFAKTEELAAESVPGFPPAGSEALHFGTVALPIIGRQRVLSAPLRAGEEASRVVPLAPLADVDHELGHLVTGLSVAVPVVLILSGGLAYLLARKALAPIEPLHPSTEKLP